MREPYLERMLIERGKESLAAFRPKLQDLKPDEILEIEFDGVITFSPSWGDEFLTPLLNEFGDRLILFPTNNLSVKFTIELLEKINEKKFRFSD